MGVLKLLTLTLCVAMATGRSPVIEPPERPVVERPNISGGNSESAGSAARVCQQPVAAGSCDESFSRYFYNVNTFSCEKFEYTGCQGNDNNFKTLADCVATCRMLNFDENFAYGEFLHKLFPDDE